MNKSPFPYYDDLNYNNYFDGNPAPMGIYFPQAHIWSSRGCPFKCIFCVWPASMTGNDPEGTKTRTVRQYSKSYINHLINSNEILASMVLTMNNIAFYQELMKKIREAIKNNKFNVFYNKYIDVI